MLTRMLCLISSIAAVFVIGMIYMNYSVKKSQIILKYKSQLPENLQDIYEQITNEIPGYMTRRAFEELPGWQKALLGMGGAGALGAAGLPIPNYLKELLKVLKN